jgi:hypothetical protein
MAQNRWLKGDTSKATTGRRQLASKGWKATNERRQIKSDNWNATPKRWYGWKAMAQRRWLKALRTGGTSWKSQDDATASFYLNKWNQKIKFQTWMHLQILPRSWSTCWVAFAIAASLTCLLSLAFAGAFYPRLRPPSHSHFMRARVSAPCLADVSWFKKWWH